MLLINGIAMIFYFSIPFFKGTQEDSISEDTKDKNLDN